MGEKESLGSQCSFSGEPFVAVVSTFRRGPCVDCYAVDSRGSLQIVEDMFDLLLVAEIVYVDINAVAYIVDGEFFSLG